MPEPESVRRAFERAQSSVSEVERYVQSTLKPYCDDHRYLFVGRTKELASLSEKLEGGRIGRWSEIDDLYACMIVVPVASDTPDVLAKLDGVFTRTGLRDHRNTRKSPDVFRFDSTRWYGKVDASEAARHQPDFGRIVFEVQVLTAFEYAWVTVSHDLVYKADDSNWKRQRLAAQLKAAVEQVELLISAFEPAADKVVDSPWPETSAKAQVIDVFRGLNQAGRIPDGLVPKSWKRFSDNVYGLVSSYESEAHRRPSAASELLAYIRADLEQNHAPLLPESGTLFQYVVTVVARNDSPGNLEGYVVVPSREFDDLYGRPKLFKTFTFDGAGVTAPAEGVKQSPSEGARGA